MKTDKKLLGTGILTAFAASLCCISPILALVAGVSGSISTFSWLEPFRPFLIGFTVLVLGYAWYRQLVSQPNLDCACDQVKKPTFMQTKLFLGIVTIFAFVLITFPSYADVFYPAKQGRKQIVKGKANIQTAEFKINGMTCAACAPHVNREINRLAGILKAETSYKKGNTIVKFDQSKTTIQDIQKAIGQTGYKISETKVKL